MKTELFLIKKLRKAQYVFNLGGFDNHGVSKSLFSECKQASDINNWWQYSHLSTKLATENAKILKYKKKEKKKSLRNQICYKINLRLTLFIRLVVMLLMFVKGIMLKFLSMNLVLNKIILEVTEISKKLLYLNWTLELNK